MTQISTEPVAAQAATDSESPPTASPSPVSAGRETTHTPGGIPVVPLVVTGANATVGMVSAAALAGGPLVAAVAATGAVVLGVAATRRAAGGRSARKAAREAARARGKGALKTSGARTGSGAAGRVSLTKGRAPSAGRAGTGSVGTRSAAGRKQAAGAGRLGRIRTARAALREQAPTRAARRAHTTGARRGLADARRQDKAGARTARAAGRGRAARTTAAGLNKAARGRDALAQQTRAARDTRRAAALQAKRAGVRKAPIRRAARKALRRSAGRFQRRRLLAAVLGGLLGLVGLASTPLGRKLGVPGLMYPGRRLYQRLTLTAAEQRAERDEVIRRESAEQEAAADAAASTENSTDAIGDTAERPAGLVPTHTTMKEVAQVSGFRFEEAAAEMESAAGSYEPDGCMEILAMVEGLPAALTSVADTMRILAERSDAEFPLEKQVADGFNDIFGALMSAVAVAEDMGPLFRQAHEQDIARHEDPRNGSEAEKGWNV